MSIVTVNVSQQIAATPNALQAKGAMISQGGTTGAANSMTLLQQASDLTALKSPALALASLVWGSSVVTGTTSAPHGYPNSKVFKGTIAGAVPVGYNGTFDITITDATTFTYPLVSNPGSETTPGTVIAGDVAELQAMVNTFFAQGASQAVYVLELGVGAVADGITALDTYITANPKTLYSYLVPREWDAVAGFLTLLAKFEATTSKTYFFVTTTQGNYAQYTAVMKCVVALIEAPAVVPTTEFSLAAAFYVSLNYKPSSTNKVTPFAFSFLVGVTAYPTAGNSALIATLLAAHINLVGTGAEGGISNTILMNGTTKDGNDFTYWYSVDWIQINVDQGIANAIINGSNNPANPLLYNQDGINRLQAVAAGIVANGVTFALVLNAPVQTGLDPASFTQQLDDGKFIGLSVVNAVPFITYSKQNPNDYAIGRYAGFTVVYTPARGFVAIVFNVIVQQFVAQ